MTIEAFRIVKTRYVQTAFDGEGARRYGGRWNSRGTAVVYTSSSISLATLEILVHLDDWSALQGLYSVIPVQFDTSLVEHMAPEELPERWNAPEPPAAAQRLGDRWVRARRSAVLSVPSSVTQSELNYLLNPAHVDFERIAVGAPVPFAPDPRLDIAHTPA